MISRYSISFLCKGKIWPCLLNRFDLGFIGVIKGIDYFKTSKHLIKSILALFDLTYIVCHVHFKNVLLIWRTLKKIESSLITFVWLWVSTTILLLVFLSGKCSTINYLSTSLACSNTSVSNRFSSDIHCYKHNALYYISNVIAIWLLNKNIIRYKWIFHKIRELFGQMIIIKLYIIVSKCWRLLYIVLAFVEWQHFWHLL